MRARGLKLILSPYQIPTLLVAPHAGAWVETSYVSKYVTKDVVAPHAGAWVETQNAWLFRINKDRRAPCGRVG